MWLTRGLEWRNVNSALFPCLHYSCRLLPKESLWPLVHCLLGKVGSIKSRVATKVSTVPSSWRRGEQGSGRCTSTVTLSLSDHAPWGPGISFQGCVSFLPRVDLPGADCISKIQAGPAVPGKAKGVGQSLDIQAGMCKRICTEPLIVSTKMELGIEKASGLWAG